MWQNCAYYNTARTHFQGCNTHHCLPRAALRLPWATCPHPHSGVNAKDMGNAKGIALGKLDKVPHAEGVTVNASARVFQQ